MDKKRYKVAAMALFFLWTAGILYGSLMPADDLPPAGWLAWIPQFDKLVHFFFYLGQVTLLILWLQPSRRNRLWIVAAAVLFSGTVELVQGTWCERSADWADMAANSLGALAGIPLSAWMGRLLSSTDKDGVK